MTFFFKILVPISSFHLLFYKVILHRLFYLTFFASVLFCYLIITIFIAVNSIEIDKTGKIPDDVLQDLKGLGLFGRMMPLKYGK